MLKESKQVLVIGAAAGTVQPIVALLQGQPDWQVSARVTALRPLTEILNAAPATDVVVVCCNDRETGDLEALAALDPAKRPHTAARACKRCCQTTRLTHGRDGCRGWCRLVVHRLQSGASERNGDQKTHVTD